MPDGRMGDVISILPRLIRSRNGIDYQSPGEKWDRTAVDAAGERLELALASRFPPSMGLWRANSFDYPTYVGRAGSSWTMGTSPRSRTRPATHRP